jgi:SNF2 family DNA or RNA helicase
MPKSSVPVATVTPLFEKLDWFQKEAVEFAIQKGSCALYMEQGTGKTWVSFGLLEQLLLRNPKAEGLIVGLLANLETTWWDQATKLFPQLNITRDWEEYKKLPAPKMLLCHYEYLTKHRKKLCKKKWTWIIVDESQRIKNRSSAASRAMRQFRYQSDNKIVLSGTPDDGDLTHYWAQFRFFAPQVFGDRWGDFDTEYLIPTGWMGKKRKFDTRKLAKFNALIEPWIKVVTNDVLNLKPPRHVRVTVDMPEHLRQRYDLMEDHLVVELKDQILAAQLPITKTVKLQQLCSGFIYDEEHNVHRFSTFRTRACQTIMERHRNEQMVIFCKYLPEIDSIEKLCGRMGLSVAILRGGRVYKKLRPQLQRDFQDGKYDVAIVQIRSGVGIDLFAAHIAIFYSTGHSSIDFQQSKARVYRRGQQNQVVYYYLVAKNSIDEDIQLALKQKRSVSRSVLTRMQTRLKRKTHHGQTRKDPRPGSRRREEKADPARSRAVQVRRDRLEHAEGLRCCREAAEDARAGAGHQAEGQAEGVIAPNV